MLLWIFTRHVFAIEPISKIIEQPNAPIKILSYTAKFSKGTQYSREGIQHSAEYQNTSDKTIVAIQLGLVSFDIWNEFLDRMGGISIRNLPPKIKEKGSWVATAYADFSFLTGVCYVSKVRFESGEIWVADLDVIADELRKIEKNFDASILRGKDKEE
ncbi:MAG: hypothetical protein DYH15_15065 [Nitrosomonas sp. PRO4]|nr:hypothetical protein [candidate division KSB1 bacterium]MCE7915938.1 hypothetical protein [Nitrosomonas sp. PRO4]